MTSHGFNDIVEKSPNVEKELLVVVRLLRGVGFKESYLWLLRNVILSCHLYF